MPLTSRWHMTGVAASMIIGPLVSHRSLSLSLSLSLSVCVCVCANVGNGVISARNAVGIRCGDVNQ